MRREKLNTKSSFVHFGQEIRESEALKLQEFIFFRALGKTPDAVSVQLKANYWRLLDSRKFHLLLVIGKEGYIQNNYWKG
jgi:hypothetical protein